MSVLYIQALNQTEGYQPVTVYFTSMQSVSVALLSLRNFPHSFFFLCENETAEKMIIKADLTRLEIY